MEKFNEDADPIDEAVAEEKSVFRMSDHSRNEIAEQLRAYSAHVKAVADETGRDVSEIIAEEKDEIQEAGMAGFLEKKGLYAPPKKSKK